MLRAAGGSAAAGVPPCDLLRVAGGPRLVLAAAGFRPDRLEITVAGDQFPVSGEAAGDGDPARVLHRGIAARRFRRALRLARGLAGAEPDRGLPTTAPDLCPPGCPARPVAIGRRSP